jgi:chromate reductase
MQTIAVLVGSLRRESINAAYARGLEKLAAGQFAFDFVDMDLPLYNNDLWANPPAKVLALKDTIKSVRGVLIVTPEYNRSLPAVTKNAIDWASRPYGESAWAGKAVAITGASPGSQGTAVAQSQLRGIMTILGTHVLSDPEVYISYKPELFAADGTVINDGTAKFLKGFLDAFAALIDKVS